MKGGIREVTDVEGCREMEKGKAMRKRITVLLAALMLALSMSFGGVAFAGGSGGHHSFHGCKHHSQGFKSSGGKCHHHNKNGGNHNGGHNGGDNGEDDD
jgi:hypothetical protein